MKTKKNLAKFLFFATAAMLWLGLHGALVDTDGNAVTNETALGDIDMAASTYGDLKTGIAPNYSNVSNAAVSALAALPSKASTNDVVLTLQRSWTVSITDPDYPFTDLCVKWGDPASFGQEEWFFNSDEQPGFYLTGNHDPNATSISCAIATASRFACYVLGSQSTKPLQPAGDYATSSDFNALSLALAEIGPVASNAYTSATNALPKFDVVTAENAASGKAADSLDTKNRTTLSALSGFTAWVFPGFPEIEEYTERNLVPYESSQGIYLEYRIRDKDWETGEWGDWSMLSSSDNYAPLNATSFTWLIPLGYEEPVPYTGTRAALSGYKLGSDTNHILAAQSAVDSAIAAKQDNLPYATNSIPQRAIDGLGSSFASKLDKLPPSAVVGHFASITSNQSLMDSGKSADDFASTNDVVLTEVAGTAYTEWSGVTYDQDYLGFVVLKGSDQDGPTLRLGFRHLNNGEYAIQDFENTVQHYLPNATNVTWTQVQYEIGEDFTTTRSAVTAYQLGTNATHLLQPSGNYVTTEADPTVPSWAKATSAPLPPDYASVSNAAMTAMSDTNITFNVDNEVFSVSTNGAVLWSSEMYVPTNRTINGKGLGGNVTLTAEDIAGIPAAQVQTDWNATSGMGVILNKPTFATVATSGSYNDLSNKPTKLSQFTNDSGFITGYTETDPTIGLTNDILRIHGTQANLITSNAYGSVALGTSQVYPDASASNSVAYGISSAVMGYNNFVGGRMATDARMIGWMMNVYHDTWVWNSSPNAYYSHGNGTFNINPIGGTDGFWIGETNFTQHIANLAPAPDMSEYVKTNSFMSVSNKVAEIEQAIDELLGGGGGGGGDEPEYGNKKIAMFIIDVNPRGSDGGTNSNVFTGFELKASTNNFALGTSDIVKLQFFSQSLFADTGLSTTGDRMKLFQINHGEGHDNRAYTRIQNTQSLTPPQMVKLVVLVDVSCLVRHPEHSGSWLNEDNENLIWCYLRDRGNSYDKIAGTEYPLWQPIAPVKWFSKLPDWAK